MPWGRFDDEYPHNRKIRKLSHEAFRLDVSGILWANKYGTDGFIPDDDLPLVCTEVRRPERCAEELANRRRWERVHGGWYIHDFLDYNPSAEQVAADREARTTRQQRWRKRKNALRDGVVDASTDGSTDTSRNASPADGSGSRGDNGNVAAGSLYESLERPTENCNGLLCQDETEAGAAGYGTSRGEPAGHSVGSEDVDASTNASRNGTVTPAPRARVPLPLPLEVLRTSDQTRPPVERKRSPAAEPEGFAEFWSAYPKKVGKQAAIKAYSKTIKAGTKPADLLAAAQLYAMDCRTVEDPHFIKHPSGWLNDGRWSDERAAKLPLGDSPPRPPWCGGCTEATRQRLDDQGHPFRCPLCHPLAKGATT